MFIDNQSINKLRQEVYQQSFNHCRKQGIRSAKNKSWNEAIYYYIQALLIKPGSDKTCYELGDILEQSGLVEEAKICYSRNVPIHLIQKYAESKEGWDVLDKISTEDHEIQGFQSKIAYSKKIVSLTQPHGLSLTAHENFNKTKIAFDDASVYFLTNGRAWANENASAVITQNNCLLQHLSTGVCNTVVASNYLPDIHKLEGNVVFLSSRWGSKAYFHWILDLLPRFELLQKIKLNLDEINYFVLYHPTTSFNQESLERLGITQDKIVDSSTFPYVQADQLIVPSVIKGSRAQEWAVKFLRDIFLQDTKYLQKNKRENIYISRKDASRRRIVNEKEVVTLLEKYGFKCVCLDSMPVTQQATLLYSAKSIVAPHGAGLTNIIFSTPGTKLVEIFSPYYVNTVYWEISNLCNLDYYYLIGEDFDNIDSKNSGAKDILVNINALESLLKIAQIV